MNTNRRGRKPRKLANVAALVENNPFRIEEGVLLQGNRSASSITAQLLFEQVKKLPVDKNVSISIPKSIAEKATMATNMVLTVKRMLEKDRSVAKNFAITVRTFKDQDGNYTNARVWRIN